MHLLGVFDAPMLEIDTKSNFLHFWALQKVTFSKTSKASVYQAHQLESRTSSYTGRTHTLVYFMQSSFFQRVRTDETHQYITWQGTVLIWLAYAFSNIHTHCFQTHVCKHHTTDMFYALAPSCEIRRMRYVETHACSVLLVNLLSFLTPSCCFPTQTSCSHSLMRNIITLISKYLRTCVFYSTQLQDANAFVLFCCHV